MQKSNGLGPSWNASSNTPIGEDVIEIIKQNLDFLYFFRQYLDVKYLEKFTKTLWLLILTNHDSQDQWNLNIHGCQRIRALE